MASYAIVREPFDRFQSSVAQYLRARVGEPGTLSTGEITQAVDQIFAGILADPEGRDIRNTVFFRQIDFVYLNGAKSIDHVYAMDDMDGFFERLETRHGLTLERDQVWNPTVTYRWAGSRGMLNRGKDLARKVLPMRSYAMLRDLGIKVFTQKGVPKLEETLMSSDRVTDFVKDYYASDLVLYHAVRDGQVPSDCP